MVFKTRSVGESLWLTSCNWCVCEVAPKYSEERENGEVRYLTQRVRGQESVDDVCTSEDLKCCVCKAEQDALNDLWASVVSHAVGLACQLFY